MSVKLRLTRAGKKKQPFYRIVAIDSRNRRDGKCIEKIGHYNPLPDPVELLINEEKALQWLNRGAIPSDTVRNLLSKQGIMLKWDLMKRGYDEARINEEFKKWEVLQLEQKKKAEALAAQSKRETDDKKTEVKKEAEAEPAPVAEPEVPVEGNATV
ncbi:MAG: 30S ribosomal protein S16 [Candidatus Zhuqueibacterota bacterium]